MKYHVLSVFALGACLHKCCAQEAPNPTNFASAVVSITRQCSAEEAAHDPLCIGVSATAWFYGNARFLVTASHFISGSSISEGNANWTDVVLRQQGSNDWPAVRKETNAVRVFILIPTSAEPLAILELRSPFTNAQILSVRAAPLTNGMPAMSLSYPDVDIRFARGTFYGIMSEDYQGFRAGAELFEMYDGLDRFAMDLGSSGAPILDEDGHVAAVLEGVFSQEVWLFSRKIRTSTPWYKPNCAAIPTGVLGAVTVPDRK